MYRRERPLVTPRAAAHEELRHEAHADFENHEREQHVDSEWRARRVSRLGAELDTATSEAELGRLGRLEAEIRHLEQFEQRDATPAQNTQKAEKKEEKKSADEKFRATLDEFISVQAEDAKAREERAVEDVSRRERLAALTSSERVAWVVGWIADPAERERWSQLRLDSQQGLDEHRTLRNMLRRLRRQKRVTSQVVHDLRSSLPPGQLEIRGVLARSLTVAFDATATPRAHQLALDAVRDALDAARAQIEALAGVIWPELRVGAGRAANIVDVRLRGLLNTWGINDREAEAARLASPELQALLVQRIGSAARHARRRTRGR